MNGYGYPGSTKVDTDWRSNLPEYMTVEDRGDGQEYIFAELGEDPDETEERVFDSFFYDTVVDWVRQHNNDHNTVLLYEFIEWVHDEGGERFGMSTKDFEDQI